MDALRAYQQATQPIRNHGALALARTHNGTMGLDGPLSTTIVNNLAEGTTNNQDRRTLANISRHLCHAGMLIQLKEE